MIDTLLVGLLIFPILIAIGGWPQLPENWDELLQARNSQALMEILAQADSETAEPAGFGGTFDFLVTWILPAIAVVVFWIAVYAGLRVVLQENISNRYNFRRLAGADRPDVKRYQNRGVLG